MEANIKGKTPVHQEGLQVLSSEPTHASPKPEQMGHNTAKPILQTEKEKPVTETTK